MKENYSNVEMMAITASRLLEDRSSVFVGTGISLVGALLARKTHAPNLVLVFEGGSIGAEVPTLPLSVGDSRSSYKSVFAGSIVDAVNASQQGYVDYGFLAGAQIDKYGNINSTCIGSHSEPKVSFPGSGGGNDIASSCWKTVIVGTHQKRRFVDKLDFLTSPGYLNGPGSRERVGLPNSTGPYRVVTDLAVMGFDEKTKVMELLSLHPSSTVEEVKENTGFDLLIPDDIPLTDKPTNEELQILREEIDPNGIYVS